MHIYTVIIEKDQYLLTERNKYVFKQDINNGSDGVRQTTYGIEFQTKEVKGYELLPSVA